MSRIAKPNIAEGVDSLTSFKRETSRFLARLKRTGEPLVLTINGKAELVVLNAATFQQLMEQVDQLEMLKALRESLNDMKAGRSRSAREALDELGRKYRLRHDV